MRHQVLFFLVLFVFSASLALAENHSVNHKTTHTVPLPTTETAAAADGSFGNGTALVPVWKGLIAEGLWYHSQGRNIGFGGVGYAIRPLNSIILIPSLYGVRGNGEHDAVALGFRVIMETRLFIGDLGLIRTFGGKKGEDHDLFVDPSHLSLRINRLQAGYAVEFFRHIGESQTIKTHSETAYHFTAAGPSTPTHSKPHKTDELLHGPRIGWKINKHAHLFYAALFKANGLWEHKIGTTFFFEHIFRKKK